MLIRPQMLCVAFIVLMLPYVSPSLVESRAVAQVSKQSRASADQQAIIEAYRTIEYGFRSRDLNHAFSVYAPGFTQVGLDGKVTNLEQMRRNWQQNFPNIRQAIVYYQFKQIQINGATATVLGIGNQILIVPYSMNSQGFASAMVSVDAVFQFQETYHALQVGGKQRMHAFCNKKYLEDNHRVLTQAFRGITHRNYQIIQFQGNKSASRFFQL